MPVRRGQLPAQAHRFAGRAVRGVMHAALQVRFLQPGFFVDAAQDSHMRVRTCVGGAHDSEFLFGQTKKLHPAAFHKGQDLEGLH